MLAWGVGAHLVGRGQDQGLIKVEAFEGANLQHYCPV